MQMIEIVQHMMLSARVDVHHLISCKRHPSLCASSTERERPQLCSGGGGCDSRIFCIANTGLTILGWLLSYLGYSKLQDPCCLTFVFLLTLGLSLMSILIVDSSMIIFTISREVNYFYCVLLLPWPWDDVSNNSSPQALHCHSPHCQNRTVVNWYKSMKCNLYEPLVCLLHLTCISRIQTWSILT